MRLRYALLSMLIMIPGLVFSVVEPQQALPITSHVNGNVKMVLIHPTEEILYDFMKDDTFREVKGVVNDVRDLQKSYDLVYIAISEIGYNQKVNIYSMKKSARLRVGNQAYDCIDFFDIEISSSGYAHFSEYSFDYISINKAKVAGFFLFPKVIDSTSTQRVSIECDLDQKKYSYEVNFEKLRNLINILSDN